MTSVLIGDTQNRDMHTQEKTRAHRAEGDVKTEMEIGVKQPQEC